MLETEHQRQLWERRANLYAEVLAYAGHRAMTREHNLKGFEFEPQLEASIKALVDSYQAPSWFAFEARVRALASDAVVAAFTAAHAADRAIVTAASQHAQIAQANRQGSGPGSQPAVAARQAVKVALEAGVQADAALTRVIRDELQHRPVTGIAGGRGQVP
jgi:hypothetical protein